MWIWKLQASYLIANKYFLCLQGLLWKEEKMSNIWKRRMKTRNHNLLQLPCKTHSMGWIWLTDPHKRFAFHLWLPAGIASFLYNRCTWIFLLIKKHQTIPYITSFLHKLIYNTLHLLKHSNMIIVQSLSILNVSNCFLNMILCHLFLLSTTKRNSWNKA